MGDLKMLMLNCGAIRQKKIESYVCSKRQGWRLVVIHK